ncbi:phosphoribosyltransferase [Campylobacter helveticus]|uniref:Phosphoribosyltransferase n=1 Tax=Campylobacter helveticus TaxID=28898 RepID=A0ABY3KZE5_9BACT|nr:phosphoribosyltransferase family protein [Campylobacter helveticus]MCR2039583.1 phosphoribosyltransferase family protein [Campylobacter helveticus]MCR2060065.1 phosphoribosyltransferase family protein [Campylobacter helveticus]MCR2065083.1 phosphoribosyltransferase family protein [Campylobacter helveticus]MCR2065878.1 phosphoribosyltransferase family protein [Campylobacter helveticus]TNB55048.1 phosphoribosyltransferase [Campylobacter helveticus]
MMFYAYDDFEKDVKFLAKKVKDEFNPDALVAIARGGLSLGHSLAVALKTRKLFTLNSIHYDDTKKLDSVEVFNIPNLSAYKRVLLIDDIVDSGESLSEIKRVLEEKFPHIELKIATIFYKKTALLEPEFSVKEAKEWVEFYWDIEI